MPASATEIRHCWSLSAARTRMEEEVKLSAGTTLSVCVGNPNKSTQENPPRPKTMTTHN